MIVAGIGCRKGVTGAMILQTLQEACTARNIALGEIGAIATGSMKASEPGIRELARDLQLRLAIVDEASLGLVSDRCLTDSPKSRAFAGVGSLSEAAALSVAGSGAQLLGPRLVADGVTCALAKSAEARSIST